MKGDDEEADGLGAADFIASAHVTDEALEDLRGDVEQGKDQKANLDLGLSVEVADARRHPAGIELAVE